MKQCIIFEIDKSECGDFTRDEIIEAVTNDKIQLKGKRAFVALHSLNFLQKMCKYIRASPQVLAMPHLSARIVWLFILLSITMTDYLSRAWLVYVP